MSAHCLIIQAQIDECRMFGCHNRRGQHDVGQAGILCSLCGFPWFIHLSEMMLMDWSVLVLSLATEVSQLSMTCWRKLICGSLCLLPRGKVLGSCFEWIVWTVHKKKKSGSGLTCHCNKNNPQKGKLSFVVFGKDHFPDLTCSPKGNFDFYKWQFGTIETGGTAVHCSQCGPVGFAREIYWHVCHVKILATESF